MATENERILRILLRFGVDRSEAERELEKIRRQSKKNETGLQKMGKTGKAALALIGTAAGVLVGVLAGVAAAATAAFERAEQAVAGVRIRRSFEALAKSANTTGAEILDAMTRASAGAVNELELMRQANVAMQLGVAKTPEEFEKLTRSAIILGRSVGRGPVEALDDLINAAGRRSTEVLDNLGISLADVNKRMDELAREQFNKPAEGLDQAQKNALFMAAALDVASQQADKLGGKIDDIGSGIDRAQARMDNFEQDFNEGWLIIVDTVLRGWEKVGEILFGSKGIFPGMVEGGSIMQETFAVALATVSATANTALAGVLKLIKTSKAALKGELSLEDVETLLGQLTPAQLAVEAAKTFQERFDVAHGNIRERFKDIFDPASAADDIKPFFDAGSDAVEDGGQELADALQKINDARKELAIDAGREIMDIQKEIERDRLDAARDAAQEREDIERQNVQRIEDILRDHQDKRIDAARDLSRDEQDIARKFARDRAALEKEGAKKRADVEKQTGEQIARIRSQFAEDIEDAVRNQDAIAFTRLQRRAQQELQQAQQDRQTKINETNTELDERRAALQAQQQQELEDARLANRRKLEDIQIGLERELAENRLKNERELEEQALAEERKRQEINLSLARQIADFNQHLREKFEDLQRSLDEEIALVAEAEKQKADIAIAESERVKQAAETVRREFGFSSPNRGGARGRPRGRQAGGYAGQGIYALGEKGIEFVLNNRTTRAAESVIGGSLTQDNLLAALAGGMSTINNNDLRTTFNFAERSDAREIMRAVDASINAKLSRFARGF